MKIVTVGQMRGLEEACGSLGITTDDLMERAGLAVAQTARQSLGMVAGKRLLVLVGPGNNGADGLVAARHLRRWGALVTAYLTLQRPRDDPKLNLALKEEVLLRSATTDDGYQGLEGELERCHLIIDAVLGTGKARPLGGVVKEVMLRLSKRREHPGPPLLALDLPTGVDADTGWADPFSPSADITVALGYPKVGLFQFPAANKRGRLEVADIGIPEKLTRDIPLELLTPTLVKSRLPSRPLDAHKGTFGHALVIGGSLNYSGAAYLASQGALRAGPGLVTLATPKGIQPVLASKLTEVIHLPLPDNGVGIVGPKGVTVVRENLSQYSSLALGCGMGWSQDAQRFIENLLLAGPPIDRPTVIDADGVNNLSTTEGWWHRLRSPIILTPHPGEMSRLTGVPASEIQAHRIEIARDWSARWRTVVVLKGAFTIIANPEGMCWVSPFANPALASGGTGDVLTGIIAGLLAQGLRLEDAACCGVFLHGAAAERVGERLGVMGTVAGDLLDALPLVTKTLRGS